MVSAYPGLFYPGQVYPGQVDTGPPPPPPPPTPWGSWILARTGTPIRRATRLLVWPGGTPTAGGHLLTDLGQILDSEDSAGILWPLTVPAVHLTTETNTVLTAETADRFTV